MKRWIKRLALGLLGIIVVAGLTAWLALRASLPQLEGELALAGLSAPVTVQRDANGMVTIDARNDADAMRALGYVHAQERYFEMDLLRRSAAGELSALFGERAVEYDTARRQHRLRARTLARIDAMTGPKRAQLKAYTEGVNAGLAALDARPWPYLLLRTTPAPWTEVDAVLAGYAMYFDLQDSANRDELAWWRASPHLPAPLRDLLRRDGTRWDAPLFGEARGDATLPVPDAVDLRRLPMPAEADHTRAADDIVPGSNNFAVAGAVTADGRAIVANDMHLGLRAPNIWFRARLRYADPDAPGGRVDVIGFTLPGLPAVITGSNTYVAWGFTNSYVDTADWRIDVPCGKAATPGCARTTTHRERIEVAGGDPVTVDVVETDWGPVLHREKDGRMLSLRWNAHLDGALGFGITEMVHARNLDEALAIADRVAVPTQNLVIGDRNGRIAWRLLGPLGQRGATCDATQPTAGDTACAPWPLATDRAPALVDPATHRLWTANNRLLDAGTLGQVGDGGYAFGARAKQIRDGLLARERLDERALLAIQLDDRALLVREWWSLLQAESGRGGALAELAAAAKVAPERASIDSVSYRITRAWRLAVHARIGEGLTAPARAALGPDADLPSLGQLEGIAWPLLQQRPAHLLPRRFACVTRAPKDATCQDADGWHALLEDAAREVRDELAQQGPLSERTWGERNTANICHPLAGALGPLGRRMLCMPRDPLPGDGAMPRVQGPSFGASERMVVSPGREAEGFAHMPGGQSGHPLSPFWGAGHADWVQGRASPFLPGKAAYTLTFTPAR